MYGPRVSTYMYECGANPNPNANPDASRLESMHFIRTTKYGTQLKHKEETNFCGSTVKTRHTHVEKKTEL